MGDANPVLSCNIALQEAVDYASHPERVTPSQLQPAVHVHRCCPACRGREPNQASRASDNGLSSSFSHLLSTEAGGMLPAAAIRHQQATTPCLPLVETFLMHCLERQRKAPGWMGHATMACPPALHTCCFLNQVACCLQRHRAPPSGSAALSAIL